MSDLVVVREPAESTVVVRPDTERLVVGRPAGVPGPAGRNGVDGHSGQPRFSGYGPPPQIIVGAEPNDVYIDLSNGDFWRLT